MKALIRSICIVASACYVTFLGFESLTAQTLSEDQIARMVNAMQASGASQADIQKAVESIQQVKAMSQQVEAAQQQNQTQDRADLEYASKSDATVTIDNKLYNLEVIKCERDDDQFSLFAQGAPIGFRNKRATLNASRKGGVFTASGRSGYHEMFDFSSGEKESVNISSSTTGKFEGNQFEFEGDSNTLISGSESAEFKVIVNCS